MDRGYRSAILWIAMSLLIGGCGSHPEGGSQSHSGQTGGAPSGVTAQMAASREQAMKSGLADKYAQQAKVEQEHAQARAKAQK